MPEHEGLGGQMQEGSMTVGGLRPEDVRDYIAMKGLDVRIPLRLAPAVRMVGRCLATGIRSTGGGGPSRCAWNLKQGLPPGAPAFAKRKNPLKRTPLPMYIAGGGNG